MLLSAAKMGLGNDGQHLETSQVTSCQWERGSVEAMLTLPHTALTSTCCPQIGQQGSNAKQKALHKQLDVAAVNMRSDECWTNQQHQQQTEFSSYSTFLCFV